MESNLDEAFPTPPSYIVPEESHYHGTWTYDIHSFSPVAPPSFSFSPAAVVEPVPVPLVTPAKPKFVSYETILSRTPGLTTCPFCQLQVTTQVAYRAGTLAWAACITMALFGLVLGCCLIPLMVDCFKDAYHTCPRCRRVLYVHKRGCCQ